MQRNNIIGKIVEEISQYLMKKGYYDIDISIRQTEKESIITFICDQLEEKLIERISMGLKVERREEIEEYFWELIGEGNVSKQDIRLIGSITDKAEIYNENNKTIIRVYRNE